MSRARNIEDAFRRWVVDETKLIVVFDNQNAPRPARPYVLISDVTGWVKAQNTDAIESVSGDKFRVRGRRLKTFQVDCFGDVEAKTNPLEILEALRDGLDDPLVVQRMHTDEYSVQDDSDVKDLSALRDTNFEPRASTDFVVAAEFYRETEPGYVERAEVNEEIIGPP